MPKQETTKWIICCTMVELPAMTNGSWDWRVRKTIQIQLITVNLLWQFVACEQSTSSFWVSTVYKNAHFLCHKFSWTIYSSASQIWSEGQRAEKIAFCAADSHCNITTKHCIDGQKKSNWHVGIMVRRKRWNNAQNSNTRWLWGDLLKSKKKKKLCFFEK